MADLSDSEMQGTPVSVFRKLLVYMSDVEGYCEKAEALPCVSH